MMVNADLRKHAEECIRQAAEIRDEAEGAADRRAALYRSAAHSLLALADLERRADKRRPPCTIRSPVGAIPGEEAMNRWDCDEPSPWSSFTDEELSMIASHLADGGTFCCKRGHAARVTVTDSIRKREILNDEAYQRWSCAHLDARNSFGDPLPPEYIQTKIRDHLESFLRMI